MSREHAFAIGVPAGAAPCVLELRGAMDLLVVDGDTAFVVDYKLSAPAIDLTPWAFQLRTYALAARDLEGVDRVFAGVVFLQGASPEPRWLETVQQWMDDQHRRPGRPSTPSPPTRRQRCASLSEFHSQSNA